MLGWDQQMSTVVTVKAVGKKIMQHIIKGAIAPFS